MRYVILLLIMQYVPNCHLANPVFAAEPVERVGEESDRLASRNSLKVMTFNIRWQGRDGEKHIDSGFSHRKPIILDLLNRNEADIIVLQEASIEQRAEIAPELKEFGMFPQPAESGDECILYRLGRFDLEDSGREHLRRVPEKPDTSIGVRDFVWVYLHDRVRNERFYVINVHMDHRSSRRGRQLDGVLIGEWIRNREYSDPVILAGDFNGTPGKPRYLYITGQRAYPGEDGITVKMPMPMLDTFRAANPNAKYTGTINKDYRGNKNRTQIDYVFVPWSAEVIDSKIIYYHINGSYPSDHFPVLSEFELR